MTMFKEEIDAKFIYAFALLFVAKLFLWVVRDRVEWVLPSRSSTFLMSPL
jgi:hypothetical protein